MRNYFGRPLNNCFWLLVGTGISRRRLPSPSGRVGKEGLAGLLLVLFTLVAVGMACPAAARADGDLVMNVEVGFDGYAKPGQPLPLRVQIDNPGVEVNGILEVAATLDEGVQVLYTRDAKLPCGSKKLFTMYIPHGKGVNYQVRLKSGDEELVSQKVRPSMLDLREVAVGVLARDPATLNHLGALKLPNEKQLVSVIHMQGQYIPENTLVLDHLDVLVVNDFSSRTLSRPQVAAVQSWVERGGMLVLAGGSGWQKTFSTWPDALMPVEVEGSRSVKGLPALEDLYGSRLGGGAFVISEGKLQKGQVLAAEGKNPILVQTAVGKGNVFYLAFDLAAAPFAVWSGNQKMWPDLLSRCNPHGLITAPDVQVEMMNRRGYEMNWVLRSIPGTDLPSAKMLGGLFVVYILVLGPGVYLLLRKMDRREWGWVVVPVLAIVFFTSIYFAGFKGKGRDVFTNIISLVQLEPDSRYAQATSYLGVFAPTHSNYQVSLAGEQLVNMLPSDRGYDGMRIDGSGPDQEVVAAIHQGQDTRISFASSTRWSMRGVQAVDVVTSPGRIESQLTAGRGGVTGTVTNRTGKTLTDCVVFNQYGYQSLGKMAPGQSEEVNLCPRISLQNFAPFYYRMFQTYPINYPRWARDQYTMEPGQQVFQRLMDVTIGPTLGMVDNTLVFVGRSDEGIEGLLAQKQPGKTYYQTVYTSSLQVDLLDAGREIDLPIGLVNGRMVAVEGQGMMRDGQGYNLNNGTATFQVDLPFDFKQVIIDELVLVAPVGESRMTTWVDMNIYNWSTGQWDKVKYQPLGNTLQDSSYVSEKGTIRVKIGAQKANQYVYLQGVTVSLKGHYRDGVPHSSEPSENGSVSEGRL